MFKFVLVPKLIQTIAVFFAVMLTAFTLPLQHIGQISLLDLRGKKVALSQIKEHNGTAIIFISPECPLCQSYTLTINKLIKEYEAKGISFIGIVPTKDFTLKSINDYRITYKSSLKILRDENNELVKFLNATITPEVFLLNKNAQVIYSGRIDNWAYELGKKRKVITDHNLKNALNALLGGKPIPVTKTKAVGCFIE